VAKTEVPSDSRPSITRDTPPSVVAPTRGLVGTAVPVVIRHHQVKEAAIGLRASIRRAGTPEQMVFVRPPVAGRPPLATYGAGPPGAVVVPWPGVW
jgi:hypothetical protein